MVRVKPVQTCFLTVPQSVTFKTTLGELKIELFCEAVPRAAENFLALCASGQYDNTLWHRNIKGFMIQTGDPTGTGKGGQSIYGAPFADEIRSTLRFSARGILAMANSGPDTNKSQFFVTYAKQPHLDSKYTIFGRVIDGANSTLDAMEKVPVGPKNRPLEEIRTTEVGLLSVLHQPVAQLQGKIVIHANPFADKSLGSV